MLLVSDLLDIARTGDPVADLPLLARRLGPDVAEPPPAPVVVWSICRQCNLSCAHCPAAATSRRSAQDLTRDEVVRILGELAAAGVRKVVWSGGEPLLRDDLPELVAAARARDIVSHLWSNGTFLHVHARALAQAGLAHADVSLDGPRERNDAARGVPGGFELAVSGLSAARAAGLPTGIRMMVARHNARDLGPMLDVAAHLDVDRFTVSHVACAARVVRNAGDDLSASASQQLMLELFERVAGAARPLPRVMTHGNDADAALLVRFVAGRYGAAAADRIERALGRGRGTEDGEGSIAIDHRGRVRPPQSARTTATGDLRRSSFREAVGC